MRKQTEMDKLVEAMQEHICDSLCKWPGQCENQKHLERICTDCPMGGYVCGILNTYNQLNDFDKSQCRHLLEELERERLKHKWIPVTDRLPEVLKNVLVYYDTNKIDIDLWDRNGDYVYHSLGKALAWMSLPEPFKAEN